MFVFVIIKLILTIVNDLGNFVKRLSVISRESERERLMGFKCGRLLSGEDVEAVSTGT